MTDLQKDLVALVADTNMEQTLKGLLQRGQSLHFRSGLDYDVFVHPRRDPGCLNEAHDFMRPLARQYRYALVMYDHAGCGGKESAVGLADKVQERLAQNGWPGRSEVVVIAPELEVWVWCPSPHVAKCLGWEGRSRELREWLASGSHWPRESAKPPHPREAMAAALYHARKPLSSAIFLQLALSVSLKDRTEPAFQRLACALQSWFPEQPRAGR